MMTKGESGTDEAGWDERVISKCLILGIDIGGQKMVLQVTVLYLVECLVLLLAST